MRKYHEYMTNAQEYHDVNLLETAGIVKFSINDEDYITYGKSIVPMITSLIVRLEQGKGVNQKIQQMYDAWGDEFLQITILEIIDDVSLLREKSKEYITRLQPSLNYQRIGAKKDGKCFSLNHRKHMSESKIGEKHNRAKLTEDQAIQVKKLALSKLLTSKEIAHKFKISPGQVRKIKNGQAWAHLKVEL